MPRAPQRGLLRRKQDINIQPQLDREGSSTPATPVVVTPAPEAASAPSSVNNQSVTASPTPTSTPSSVELDQQQAMASISSRPSPAPNSTPVPTRLSSLSNRPTPIMSRSSIISKQPSRLSEPIRRIIRNSTPVVEQTQPLESQTKQSELPFESSRTERGLSPPVQKDPARTFSVVTDTLESFKQSSESELSSRLTRSLARKRKLAIRRGEQQEDEEEEHEETAELRPVQKRTELTAVNRKIEDASASPSPPPLTLILQRIEKRDDQGRVILDPEDLPRYGRGHRRMEVDDAENKVINIETFTMAHLCQDIPLGRTNGSAFEKYEEARLARKEKRESKYRAKRLAKKQGTPLSELYRLQEQEQEKRWQEIKEHQNQFLKDYNTLELAGPASAPQLKLTATGNISLDHESTVVDRHQHQEANREEREVVEEEVYSKVINSASFSLRERAERWDVQETEEFYNAISMWGTDFNLIAQMMPGRTRRQVRSKFKLEERKNPAKIHLAILRKLPVKMDAYQDLTIHTPESIEQEIRDLRARHEELMKMEEAAREEAIRQDAERSAKADAEKYGFKDVHKEEEEE